MSIIEVSNLTKVYTYHKKQPGVKNTIGSLFSRQKIEKKAVDDISFDVKDGEIIGFIGPNGAGKTTTLKILSGLLYPTSGNVTVMGFNPWERKKEFQKQFIYVTGQKNQLWWDLPAYETFLLNKEIYEVSDENFKKRLKFLTEILDISDILTTQVKKLSLGQRMKAELVAALIHSPKVIFLDEPTIGLDVVAQKNMRDFIKNYNEQFRSTIILTSHYMGDVEKLTSRVVIINKGKIIYDGKLANIVKKYSSNKVISLDFDKKIEKQTLGKYGKVLEIGDFTAKIEVKRDEVITATETLLKSFDVNDLTIEDPPIEEIIRLIYARHK